MASQPLLVAIAGGTGSGKTTLTRKLSQALGPDLAVIEHDFYYKDRSHLPSGERRSLNYDEPAALDNDLLLAHLAELRAGRPVRCPQYDFATHTRRAQSLEVEPAAIVAVEGILLLAIPELAETFDLNIFDMLERGRSLDSIEAQYHQTVRPMHLLHVEPSKRRAHLIVPEGGENAQALDVIVGKLRFLLLSQGGQERPGTSHRPA